MSLPEISATLRRVVGGLARIRAQLTAGYTAVAGVRDRLLALSQGSERSALDLSVAGFATASQVLRQADALVASAIADLVQYAHRIGIDISAPDAAPALGPDDPQRVGDADALSLATRSASPPSTPSWVVRAAQSLPRRAADQGPTHGYVFDVDGRPAGGRPTCVQWLAL